jgi:hypothetical protein
MRHATGPEWCWPDVEELAHAFEQTSAPYDDTLPLPSFEEARDA